MHQHTEDDYDINYNDDDDDDDDDEDDDDDDDHDDDDDDDDVFFHYATFNLRKNQQVGTSSSDFCSLYCGLLRSKSLWTVSCFPSPFF